MTMPSHADILADVNRLWAKVEEHEFVPDELRPDERTAAMQAEIGRTGTATASHKLVALFRKKLLDRRLVRLTRIGTKTLAYWPVEPGTGGVEHSDRK